MPLEKRAVMPAEIRLTADAEPVATLADLKEHLGATAPTTAAQDATMTAHLAAASAQVQGPHSITGRCFTDHALVAVYPSAAIDLHLPGGRVKEGTTLAVVDDQGRALTVARVQAHGLAYYARLADPHPGEVRVTWISAHGRVPGPVKEACLRLAAAYLANPGDEAGVKAEADARRTLARGGWA